MKKLLLILPILFLWFPNVSHAAIAFDAATEQLPNTSASPYTLSHTVTGTHPVLFFGFLATNATTISSVTYNGSAMTQICTSAYPSSYTIHAYYINNPSTGANNISVSFSGTVIYSASASYTGADQTFAVIDNMDCSNNTATTIHNSTVTTTSDNSWHTGVFGTLNFEPSAGAGTTVRGHTGGDNFGWYDNNAAITPAGNNTIGVTTPSNDTTAWITFGIKPFGATVATPTLFSRIFNWY